MGFKIKFSIAFAVLFLISSSLLYIKTLKAELQTAVEVQAKMQLIIDGQAIVMERQAKDLKKQQEINIEVNKKFDESQKEVDELQKKFANRNFDKLVKQKPDAVERKINRATQYALRCNELVTGAPLTNKEKTGKIQNTICRDLIKELRKQNETVTE